MSIKDDADLKFENFLKRFVQYTLRKASLRWPERTEALRRARIERGMYKCALCEDTFGRKEIQVDHIHPVIAIKEGYTDFDDYIRRLFVKADGFQIICRTCHDAKTAQEDSLRAIYNKKRKKNAKKN